MLTIRQKLKRVQKLRARERSARAVSKAALERRDVACIEYGKDSPEAVAADSKWLADHAAQQAIARELAFANAPLTYQQRNRRNVTDGLVATGRFVKIDGERVPVMKRVSP